MPQPEERTPPQRAHPVARPRAERRRRARAGSPARRPAPPGLAVTPATTKPLLAEGVGFEPTEARRPQRLSRPSHSSALASFRPGTLLRATLAEERTEQRCGLLSEHPVRDGRVVVEPWVGAHVVQR